MKKMFILSGLVTGLIVFFSFSTKAQVEASDIPLKPEDKKAIIALFRRADPKFYRLQFNSGRDTYGRRKVTTAETEKIKEVRSKRDGNVRINFNNGGIIIICKDGSTIAASSPTGKTGRDVFLNLLGKEGASKLRDLLSQYVVHEVEN